MYVSPISAYRSNPQNLQGLDKKRKAAQPAFGSARSVVAGVMMSLAALGVTAEKVAAQTVKPKAATVVVDSLSTSAAKKTAHLVTDTIKGEKPLLAELNTEGDIKLVQLKAKAAADQAKAAQSAEKSAQLDTQAAQSQTQAAQSQKELEEARKKARAALLDD